MALPASISLMAGLPELTSVPMQSMVDRLRQSYDEALDKDVAMTAEKNVLDRVDLIITHHHIKAKVLIEIQSHHRCENHDR